MDGQFTHNSANFRNTYSTLLVAFLTQGAVQIDGVPGCDATVAQAMDLWGSQIGIF